jgi:hypothetical protein
MISITSISSQVWAQSSINIDDHRPLRQAVETLEGLFSYPINYEDPPYLFKEDIEDVSTSAQRAENKEFRLMVPRRHQLSFVIPQGTDYSDISSLEKILIDLIEKYNTQNAAGKFRLVSNGTSFTVEPTSTRNNTGDNMLVESPMTTLLTHSENKVSLFKIMTIYISLIKNQNGVDIAPGVIPLGPWGEFSIDLNRAEIRNIFTQINNQLRESVMSYELLYDPKLGYMLNTRTIPKGQQEPAQLPENVNPTSRFFSRTAP